MKNTLGTRWALIVYCVIVLGFFYQVLLGKLPVPSDALVGLYHPWRDYYSKEYPRGVPFKNFLITDPVRQQIPWRKLVIDYWKSGKIPSWNPYSFSGTSLVANIQASAFYPLNILFFIFSFPIGWTILIVLQPILAGLFMFIYLRSIQLTSTACLIGALLWSFSGFSIAWLTWGTIGHTALWGPLVLVVIDRLARARGIKSVCRNALLLGGITSVQFFAGHTQIALYLLLLEFLYGLIGIRSCQSSRERRVTFLGLGMGALVFVLITSIQWVPMTHILAQSGRVVLEAEWTKEGWFLPWEHLIQFAIPDYFGNPATLNYWGKWNYGEFIGYIGVLGLALSVIGMVNGGSAMVHFWVFMLGLAFLLALPTPISEFPYRLSLPIISSLQPTRFIVIIDMSLSILAAVGFDAIGKKKSRSILLILIVTTLTIGSAFLYSIFKWYQAEPVGQERFLVSIRNSIFPFLVSLASLPMIMGIRMHVERNMQKQRIYKILSATILLVLVFDLYRFGWKFTSFTPTSYFFPQTKTISFLQELPKPNRIMSIDPQVLAANTGSYYGIESIDGYDPISALGYEEMIAAIERGKPNIDPPFGFNRIISASSYGSKVLRLFSITHVVTLSEKEDQMLKKVFEEGETKVYEVASPLPRIRIASHVLQTIDKQETFDLLFNDDFDLVNDVVIEKKNNLLNVPIRQEEQVAIISYERDRIAFSVNVVVPRVVVIANQYDKGWKPFVDGSEADLLRTNYIFQGLIVPSGKHDIVVQYSPWY